MGEAVILVSGEGLGGVVPFGRQIRAMGFRPVLITGPVNATLLETWSGLYDTVHVADDPYNPVNLRHLATSGREPLAGLFSCYDGLILPAARCAAELGLPHPELGGIVRSRNKHAMRTALSRHGIHQPRYSMMRSREDAGRAVAETGFPSIVKPLNGMASHLVKRVTNLRELRSTYSDLEARICHSFRGNYSQRLDTDDGGEPLDPRSDFLVEQFVEGEEYSAEILVSGGRFLRVALFHKCFVDQNGFLEKGFTCPACDDEEDERKIWEYIETCLRAMKVDDTAAHVEVISSPSETSLVEVNAGRAGGQILVRAVREKQGIDLLSAILALATGSPLLEMPHDKYPGRVSTITIFPQASGEIEQIEGLEQLESLPGVCAVVPFVAVGDVIDCRDKEVFAVNLLLKEVEREDLGGIYREAERLVRIRTRPVKFAETVPFRPSTSAASVHMGRIRVAGRVHKANGHLLELRDGQGRVRVKLRDSETSVPVFSWLGVEGSFNSGSGTLEDATSVFLRVPRSGVADAARRGLPEASFLLSDGHLEDVYARAKLVRFLRSFFERWGFLEVQTPFLHEAPEAAHVHQYETTACNGRSLFLRTDPEEYLKRYLTAGIPAVFEISTNVRGEVPGPNHLQEFTSLECYQRFWTLQDAIRCCQSLVRETLMEFRGALETKLHDVAVNLETSEEITVRDAILQYCELNLDWFPTAESLSAEMKQRGWWEGWGTEVDAFRRTWVEWLLENKVLPRLAKPTYLTHFPEDLGLSARALPEMPGYAARAEYYLPGGFELAQLYENITEENEILKRYTERLRHRVAAGLKQVALDEGLMESMAIGMPPMGGFAIGVDRLLILILGHGECGAGLLFPREGFVIPTDV